MNECQTLFCVPCTDHLTALLPSEVEPMNNPVYKETEAQLGWTTTPGSLTASQQREDWNVSKLGSGALV